MNKEREESREKERICRISAETLTETVGVAVTVEVAVKGTATLKCADIVYCTV